MLDHLFKYDDETASEISVFAGVLGNLVKVQV